MILRLGFLALISVCLWGCNESSNDSDTCPELEPERSGLYLFNYHCAGCHGEDAKGRSGRPDIRGKSETAIRLALEKVALMSHLQSLTDDEIEKIAEHLLSLKSITGQVYLGAPVWADVELMDSTGVEQRVETDPNTGFFSVDGTGLAFPILVRAKQKYSNTELLGVSYGGSVSISPLSDLMVRGLCRSIEEPQRASECLPSIAEGSEVFTQSELKDKMVGVLKKYSASLEYEPDVILETLPSELSDMQYLLEYLAQNRLPYCSDVSNPLGIWLANDVNADCLPDQGSNDWLNQ